MATSDLVKLLDEATEFVSRYDDTGGFCYFDTGAEFAAELRKLRDQVAQQDWLALPNLIGIFAPTGVWDDGIGAVGMGLANRIMAVLKEMDWARLSAKQE